jgi:hypothetical protein
MQHKPGFGLLEALLTLAIVLVMASVITTSMIRDSTPDDLKNIFFTINNMMNTARREASTKHCAMRLHIYTNTSPHTITLEQETPNLENPGSSKFVPTSIIGEITSYRIPTTWAITAVYQASTELLVENKKHATCALAPTGILPPLLIHLQATKTKQVATLKAEPFLRNFTLHHQRIAPPKKASGKK